MIIKKGGDNQNDYQNDYQNVYFDYKMVCVDSIAVLWSFERFNHNNKLH